LEEQKTLNLGNTTSHVKEPTDLTLQETNEMLKQLPKILNQMKNIILSNNHNLASLQIEVQIMKSEQMKFKNDITQVLNIISEKFTTIDKLQEDLSILDQVLGKKITELEDEIVLTQQMATKSLNEVLKFKEHWKI
jgi:predicted  nucleic acid-binding Zn-ribbon protein